MKKFIFPLLLLYLIESHSHGIDLPQSNIKLSLVDEQGKSVKGHKVGSSSNYEFVSAVTDERGQAEFVRPTTETVSVGADKTGYYPSRDNVYLERYAYGKWQPWPLETTLILRKIENPLPMYAVEDYDIEMPFIGTAGFDLEKLDWAEPFGKGIHSDFNFSLKRKGTDEKGEATLKLTFSNPGDGVIPLYEYLPGGSELKIGKLAPETGYLPEREWSWAWAKGMSPENAKLREGYYNELHRKQKESPPPLAYFFRIRTVLDKKGNVVSAMYGKLDCGPATSQMGGMRGDLEWIPTDPKTRTTKIRLTYYLNPDGTRRLEFDREKNLFKELPPEFNPHFP